MSSCFHRLASGRRCRMHLLLFALLSTASAAEIRPAAIDYHGWPAWRLANGEVEVVVVPAIGRIMRYAFTGGDNALWQRPGSLGIQRQADWINFGGDKVLMGPHEQWAAVFGAMWPPRFSAELQPHTAEVLADGRLRLISPVIAGLGFRIVRDIALDPQGSGVGIDSVFEQVESGPGTAWAVWVVAQVPRGRIYARMIAPPQGAQPVAAMFGTWPAQSEPLPALREFAPPVDYVKLRLVADRVASRQGGQLFTIRPLAPALGQDMAQLFGTPADPRSAEGGRLDVYNEIELASACRVLAVGSTQRFAVRWSLQRLADEAGPAAVLEAMTTP